MKIDRKFIIVAALLALLSGWWFVRFSLKLVTPPGGNRVITFQVERGKSLREIAIELQKAGIISSARYFAWLGRKKGMEKRVQAGEYELSSNWYPMRILNTFATGKIIERRFTVPEGMTLRQIARKLDREGVVNEAAFITAATDTSVMTGRQAPGARNLEGVLFPDTYAYTSGDNARDIVRMMYSRFEKIFMPMWKTRKAKLNLKPYEAIIMASMVEKETAVRDERAIVAGVFINRLRKGIRLMSDPTVIYGIPNFNGNLTRADLQRPSPYNTYLKDGLPPGPICNPGRESLRAALHPARTDALYFVARGDGKHHFSNTLREHNDAVKRYQKRRGG